MSLLTMKYKIKLLEAIIYQITKGKGNIEDCLSIATPTHLEEKVS